MRGFGYKRTRRNTKAKSPIRVKRDRVAKKGGKCNGCRGRFEVGDKVTIVQMKRRVFHAGRCEPPNIDQITTLVGTAQPQAGPVIPKTAGEAAMAALVSLEHALVLRAKTQGITPEMEKQFDRYNKLKGMALRPGSDNEGRMAMLQSVVSLVKLVFG